MIDIADKIYKTPERQRAYSKKHRDKIKRKALAFLERCRGMREIVENGREFSCRCGNKIRVGELVEVMHGIRRYGKRCLGCYVASPVKWWRRPRQRAMPYQLALKKYYVMREEENREIATSIQKA